MKKIIQSVSLILLFVILPFFSFGQITANAPDDGLYNNRGVIDRTPMPLPSVRKADIMWSKRIWCVIDFHQKMNNVFYFPTVPQQNWKSFITVIMDALRQGQITAYEINSDGTDELRTPITYRQIIDQYKDTIIKKMRSAYTGNDTIVKYYHQFDPTQVTRLRLKEDWYFDSKRSEMLMRIEALCPVVTQQLGNGQESKRPMFWISYADARKVLAKALAFNPANSAARLSFDDIFMKRLFESYIYKEQNMFDRRINAYATGVNAIRESNRIKREMFNFEQYLWQY